MIRAEIRTKVKTITGSARCMSMILERIDREGNSRICILFSGEGNLSSTNEMVQRDILTSYNSE